jgi:acetoacetyl-CoA synthetase
VNPQSKSKYIDLLIPIWQRALGTQQIGIHDNFFELGGNFQAGEQLFLEAAHIGAKRLPSVMIYAAPTIAEMAQLIEHPDAFKLPAAILLKTGAHRPPVFILHGLGSSVLELRVLALAIDTDRSVYGLQAKGTEGQDEPHDNVEQMAEFYLETIRSVQPQGPYILIGYSFGGLVMMEVAHRLQATGERVAFLAMVDTYPTRRAMRPVPFMKLAVTLAKRRVLRKMGLLKSSGREAANLDVQRQKDLSYAALEKYRPRFYDGTVHFLRAAETSSFPADPVPVWSHIVRDLHVETVPGNHLEMLDLHPEALAAALSRYLNHATDAGDGARVANEMGTYV